MKEKKKQERLRKRIKWYEETLENISKSARSSSGFKKPGSKRHW